MKERSLDCIHVRNLRLRAVVRPAGTTHAEPEELTVNLALSADLGKACRSDQLEDSIDYSRLKKAIMAAVEGTEFQTLEAVAERVAGVCLGDRRVRAVQACVERDPALEPIRRIGVTVTRGRFGRNALRRRARRTPGSEERRSLR